MHKNDTDFQLLLIDIRERLTRVETRMDENLPDIKTKLTELERRFGTLQVKVAGTSATIALVITFIVALFRGVK